MQTRRKSLNLGDLGVVAPKRARAPSHPSPPETVVEGEEPPVKKSKRSHGSGSPSPGLMSPPRTTTIRVKEEKRKSSISQLSPPPSPAAEGYNRVDTEGIKDDIVVGVIRQLEETGNRPHLVRELAAVLTTSLRSVEKYGSSLDDGWTKRITDRLARSANQSALISSRLTAYLQRPWPTMSPCPLAKEISTVHPRRLYYYLTTSPRQPLPTHSDPPPKPANRIISPSLSSAAPSEDEARDLRERQALSPSPEVDLSSPEFEEAHGPAPLTPGTSFSDRNSLPRERHSYTASRRASPPLENEERDFKQTATALHEQAQARRTSQQDVDLGRKDEAAADDQGGNNSVTMSIEGIDPTAELFNLRIPNAQQIDFSSPVIKPQTASRIDSMVEASKADEPATRRTSERDQEHVTVDDLRTQTEDLHLPDSFFSLDNLRSPEDIDLEELEDLFDAY